MKRALAYGIVAFFSVFVAAFVALILVIIVGAIVLHPIEMLLSTVAVIIITAISFGVEWAFDLLWGKNKWKKKSTS